ncbi:solute carrier family 23 protein [Culicoidibacter larvae]|uniref:Uracil permease n=1 Tax=Culicoidibacter larvae TaxID=2579976 RepID=A0A5R8QF33_9FIRM|nr:solute carrier family 23 protein [Culicoidibacter larvae]TLG75279.1 uracil permease [Culicoidibacter larvae]
MAKVQLVMDVNEKPKNYFQWGLLSLQHVFAMFGSTVLVPYLVGFPPEIALFASGVGTLIYILSTKGQSPVYLGSSFAFITPMIAAGAIANGLGLNNAFMGVALVGCVYIILAFVIKIFGTKWFNYILPPVVIGPVIIVIGLGLASVAIGNAGLLEESFNVSYAIVAAVTTLSAVLALILGKGYIKLIPILIGIVAGYVTACILGIVDFTPVIEQPFFAMPAFSIPFVNYTPEISLEMISIMLPVAIVTVAEHVGDHVVLGSIIGKDLIHKPGLFRTLLGDGIATLLSGLVGGPVETTYAENTGVISMTRIASVFVLGTAAVIAVVLSFIGKFSALISTIPTPVMGGVSIILFGLIALNGVRVLVDNKIDLLNQRNQMMIAIIIVLGLGGAVFFIGPVKLSGMALAAIVGIVLHLVLPGKDAAYGTAHLKEYEEVEDELEAETVVKEAK